MTRKTITIKTFEARADYENWQPDDFLMKMAAAIASIPEDVRRTGACSVELESCDDRACLTIWYARDETDEEYAKRLAHEAQVQARSEAYELEQYRALRKRFGHLPEE